MLVANFLVNPLVSHRPVMIPLFLPILHYFLVNYGLLFADVEELEAENLRLNAALSEIWAVASGEKQFAMDDTAGMEWITDYVSSISGEQKS